MLLSKRYRNARKKKDTNDYEKWSSELEKNDTLAMLIAAFIVIVPAILIAFGIIGAVIWLFFFR